MAKGKVARFFDQKGYGFIEPEGGGKDLFVHINEVEGGQLQEGDTLKNRTIESGFLMKCIEIAVKGYFLCAWAVAVRAARTLRKIPKLWRLKLSKPRFRPPGPGVLGNGPDGGAC